MRVIKSNFAEIKFRGSVLNGGSFMILMSFNEQ